MELDETVHVSFASQHHFTCRLVSVTTSTTRQTRLTQSNCVNFIPVTCEAAGCRSERAARGNWTQTGAGAGVSNSAGPVGGETVTRVSFSHCLLLLFTSYAVRLYMSQPSMCSV